jgi:hypothetical protein
VWDLNLKGPIKFKSKTYPLTPLMGHQPTGHRSPSPADLFRFPPSSPARPAQPTTAGCRDPSPPLPPGAADGRVPPASFPLPPDRPRPRLPLAPLRRVARSVTGSSNRRASSFSLFFPAAAPLARVTRPLARRPAPQQPGVTARPRALPFPRTPTARAASPNPSRTPSGAAMPPPSWPGRQKAPAAAAPEP